MLVSIDFSSEVPIYEQLIRQIVVGIANGSLTRGEPLPSVRQLGQDLGINLHTVNKAYNRLKAMGYVQIDRRSGSYISEEFPPVESTLKEEMEEELRFIFSDWMNRRSDPEELFRLLREIQKEIEVK